MQKRAIIFDLDNTIYSVHAIGHALFQPLFNLIEKDASHRKNMDAIKDDIMRRPFQLVAMEYDFSEDLIQASTNLLQNLTYNSSIEVYPDYKSIRHLQVERYLVTTGFKKLQQSKIDGLNIADDFIEIHIVDPAESSKTKKDVFTDIMQRHNYDRSEVLVIGDDLNSEIKAAKELNIEAVLYDRSARFKGVTETRSMQSFEELLGFL